MSHVYVFFAWTFSGYINMQCHELTLLASRAYLLLNRLLESYINFLLIHANINISVAATTVSGMTSNIAT